MTRALVIDQSRSMPPAIAAHKARLISDAQRTKGPGDRLAVVVFGATSLVELYPDPDRPPQTTLGKTLNTDESNLHGAISAAAELIPAGQSGRILVVSDGQSSDSMPDELRTALQQRGIPIDFEQFVGDEQQMNRDIALREVTGAHEVPLGTEIRFEYSIAAAQPANVTVHVRRDSSTVATIPVELRAGTTVGKWSTTADRAGAFRYSFSVQAANDPSLGNNTWDSWVRVRGKPTVLVVNSDGTKSPIASLLEMRGIDYELSAADQCDPSLEKLSGYACCVLEDVGISDLPPLFAQNAVTYVERLGGGLIVSGGNQSFGTGGYRASPLDPLLPVALRSLAVRERPSQVLVVLVDPAAWDAQNYPLDQLSPLQKALLSLVSELDPADRIGIVALNGPDPALLPVTVAGKREVRETISGLGFSSDPSMFPRALSAAWDMLGDSPQVSKHLLVLAESNEIRSWPPPQFDPLVKRPLSGATVTLVTWGSPDVNAESQLRYRLPGGHVVSTSDVRQLSQVLRQDWDRTSGGSHVNRATALARRGTDDAAVKPLPTIDGYYTATLRERATDLIVARDMPTQPIVARWDREAGRVSVFMFQVDEQRDSSLEDMELYTVLSDQIRWTARLDEFEKAPRFSIQLDKQQLTVRSEQPNEVANETREGLELCLIDSDGLVGDPVPFSGDRSAAAATITLTGTRSVVPIVRRGNRLIAQCSPVVLPRSPEFLRVSTVEDGRELLSQLAHQTGGTEWRSGSRFFDPVLATMSSLIPIFALCALGLLVLDVADRRYQLLQSADGRRKSQRTRPQVDSKKAPGIDSPEVDPFELAKQRMQRRVQR